MKDPQLQRIYQEIPARRVRAAMEDLTRQRDDFLVYSAAVADLSCTTRSIGAATFWNATRLTCIACTPAFFDSGT